MVLDLATRELMCIHIISIQACIMDEFLYLHIDPIHVFRVKMAKQSACVIHKACGAWSSFSLLVIAL